MEIAQQSQKNFQGNLEQLDILRYALKKNSIDFWNSWRRDKGSTPIDLTGANLSGADLTNADFKEVILKDADLSRAILIKANLSGADLTGADLSEAALINVNGTGCILSYAYLYNTDCSDSIFIEAQLIHSNLREAVLRGARLDAAVIQHTDLTNADMAHSSLQDTRCEKVHFTGAHIYGWKTRDWKPREVHCEYIYINEAGTERLPKKRKFRPGEFEGYIINLYHTRATPKKTVQHGRTLHHVFLSHSSDDAEYVKKLANALEIHGITVWYERQRLQPGVSWQTGLKNAIENGMYFIACFSKNYIRHLEFSMREEVRIVFDRLQKEPQDLTWFIPIKIIRCDIPNKKIGKDKSLINLQWIDLSRGWNEGITEIVERIQSV